MSSAQQSGATGVPEANKHLTMAQDELNKAKGLIKEGDNKKAEAMLTRAEADAALASSLSREAQQKAAADAMVQRVRSMQSTMQPTRSR